MYLPQAQTYSHKYVKTYIFNKQVAQMLIHRMIGIVGRSKHRRHFFEANDNGRHSFVSVLPAIRYHDRGVAKDIARHQARHEPTIGGKWLPAKSLDEKVAQIVWHRDLLTDTKNEKDSKLFVTTNERIYYALRVLSHSYSPNGLLR